MEWIDAFLKDLYDSVEQVRHVKFGELGAALNKEFGDTDPDTLSDQDIRQLLEMGNAGSDEFPEQMAEISEMLDALPAKLRERLMIEYTNGIF